MIAMTAKFVIMIECKEPPFLSAWNEVAKKSKRSLRRKKAKPKTFQRKLLSSLLLASNSTTLTFERSLSPQPVMDNFGIKMMAL